MKRILASRTLASIFGAFSLMMLASLGVISFFNGVYFWTVWNLTIVYFLLYYLCWDYFRPEKGVKK